MITFKQLLEAIKNKTDKGEYDYEGDMAKSQLRSIIANSKRIHDMLDDDTNLPEWVQSKITLAEDYISTASNYLQSELTEEGEAPTNNADDGKVAGMGGSSGEPGVEPKKKKSLVMGMMARKLPNNI